MTVSVIRIEGLDRLQRKLGEAPGIALAAAGAGLYQAAQPPFRESQRIVPVDTGTLKSSGDVSLPQMIGSNTVQVIIGYGGAAKEYAEIVHERMDAYHAAPTQAKYLQAPVLAAMPQIELDVALAVRIGLARLAGP